MSGRLTIFQEWVVEWVEVALKDLRAEVTAAMNCIPPAAPEQQAEMWTRAEQKIAVLLVQARALEDRHCAGQLLLRCAGQPAAMQLASWMEHGRSKSLEEVAKLLAQPDGWPPKAAEVEPKPSMLVQ